MSAKKKVKPEEVLDTPQEVIEEVEMKEDGGADLNEAELKAQSEAAQQQLKEQQDKAKEEVGPVDVPAPRMYSEADVKAMLAQVMKKGIDDEDDGELKELTPIVRLPRFQNKFIVGFKNMNTDEYAPNKVVYAFDVLDKEQFPPRNVPWVTLVFEDGSELAVPFQTALKRSNKIRCELVERKEVDVSYSQGKVEMQEVQDGKYHKDGTGVFIKAKVTQKKESFILRLPNGNLITAAPEVINWGIGEQTQ